MDVKVLEVWLMTALPALCVAMVTNFNESIIKEANLSLSSKTVCVSELLFFQLDSH